MRKAFAISTLILVALMSFSCREAAVDEPAPLGGRYFEIGGNLLTRTVYDGANGALWRADDAIGVVAVTGQTKSDAELQPFTIVGNDSDTQMLAEVSFGGTLTDYGHNTYSYYAVYPYRAHISSNDLTQLALMLPDRQYPVQGSWDGACDVMIARPVTAESDNVGSSNLNLNLAFARLFGFLRLDMSRYFAAAPKEEVASEVAITLSGEHPASGDFTVDITGADTDSRFECVFDSTAGRSITLDLTGQNIPLRELNVAAVLNPVEYEGVTITVTSNYRRYTLSRSGINLTRGNMLSARPERRSNDRVENLLDDRAVLGAIFDATDGVNWKYSDGWKSQQPLNEWYGVEVNSDNRVVALRLGNNNLNGELPEQIGMLDALERLNVESNGLYGGFPAALGELDALRTIDLYDNSLSGRIPQPILDHGAWNDNWLRIVQQKKYDEVDFETAVIRAPQFTVTTIDGQTISSSEVYAANRLTILFRWSLYFYDSSRWASIMQSIWRDYGSRGVQIIGYSDESESIISNFVDMNGLTFPHFRLDGSRNSIPQLFSFYLPAYFAIDSSGRVVSHYISDSIYYLRSFVEDCIDGDNPDLYTSTDFSADGRVECLHAHTVGNGVKIVLMGDGYSDRQIASGEYRSVMSCAADHFFDEEPLKSLRNYFDVYYIDVVSKNEGVADGHNTALKCSVPQNGNSYVDGYDERVFRYARRIDGFKASESVVTVILNSRTYAGTSFMDEKDNSAVCYFPLGKDDWMFGALINHEAVGHGFGKLLDEYSYYGTGAMPDSAKESFIAMRNKWGWGPNVDITDDPQAVYWAKFLDDSRYSEGRYSVRVGIYSGALTYWEGAWRATYQSIMSVNDYGFNPPSREALYRRVIELSGGTYSWDDFLEYDAINRAESQSAAAPNESQHIPARLPMIMHHPPVILYDGVRKR